MTDQNLIHPDLLSTAYLHWFEELSDRGIFATDAALQIRSWNPWLEDQTGISSSMAIGTPLFELYPSIVERGLDRYYHEVLEGQVRILAERFHKHLLPIGCNVESIGLSEMAQSVRIAPLTANGEIVGTITVIEDVTERVVSERELRNQIAVAVRARAVAEEASKLKDDFLATLSHEIRTPLNAVLGWARILRTTPTIKSRTRALEVIERNAASQLRLVEDLLDMARVMSGKLRLDVKVVDLKDVVQAAIDVVTPAAEAKNITVTTTFDDRAAAVNGDADRLQQAAWNVMSNAVKFTEPGGRVAVALTVREPNVVLTVSDSGQGISREFLPFIFDRFRQADSSASRRHGGLGLGLALVRQIVELHGGSVSAESSGTNQGSVFTVRFPVAKHPVGSFDAPANAGELVTLKGVTVLVVDDNEDGREMLVTALRQYGAIVRAAASSSEALALLSEAKFRPDVLVSDVGMADMDGYKLLESIRSLPYDFLRVLPAIAVTAYANPEDRVRAAVAGFQVHLAKPIDPARVAASVASVAKARGPVKRKRMEGIMRLPHTALYAVLTAALMGQPGFAQGLGGAAQPLPQALLQCDDVSKALLAVANQDTRLRDWANLARYRDANKTVTRPDVVLMGDSITDFWQQPRFGGFFPGKNYVDRGISAQTTPQMLVRMRPDVIALKPKVVVILAGTNDIAGNTGPMTDDEIQGNIASMAESASANGIKVVLSSITPVSEYHAAAGTAPQTTRRPVDRIKKINDWMRSYASAHKHVYLDYYSKMVDGTGMLKTEFSADDLHPTTEGYAAMAPLVEMAVAQALR